LQTENHKNCSKKYLTAEIAEHAEVI